MLISIDNLEGRLLQDERGCHFSWRPSVQIKSKPRLSNVYVPDLEKEEHIAIIVDSFIEWFSYDEYIIFKAERKKHLDNSYCEKRDCEEIHKNETLYTKYKVRKRGNDVYLRNHSRKIRQLQNIISKLVYVNRGFTNVLYQVLTVEPEISRTEAYYIISIEFNRYKTSLEQIYGKIYHIWSIEATLNLYPHMNAILIFSNHRFPIKRHRDKNGRLSLRLRSYRLKEQISQYWDLGFVDIQAPKNVNDVMNYIMKYCLKDLEAIQKIDKNLLNEKQSYYYILKEKAKTNPEYEALFKALVNIAILWYERKRIYSYSFDLIHRCNRLMHNYSYNVDNLRWSVIGIYNKDEITMFLIWLCKVKKYIDIIVDDNLLTEMIYIQKLKIKQKEMKKEISRLEYLERLNLEKYV